MKRTMKRAMMVSACALVLAACASRSPGSRPDDMSSARHRENAAQHGAAADRHRGEYDPNATETRYSRRTDVGSGQIQYNPTRGHLSEAESHEEESRQHVDAATELERFEGAECQNVPAATRASCPLLHEVSSVADIEGGVRLRAVTPAEAAALVARIRCHLAFARSHGRVGMETCPLYAPDVQVRSAPGGIVELTSTNEGTARLLRERTRTHAVP